MYFSTVHWLPLGGGYTAYPPPDTAHRRRLVEALPDPDALDELVAATGVGWIVVHTAGRPLPSQWAGTLPPGLALVRRWPEATLFRVTRPQATARGAPDTRR